MSTATLFIKLKMFSMTYITMMQKFLLLPQSVIVLKICTDRLDYYNNGLRSPVKSYRQITPLSW